MTSAAMPHVVVIGGGISGLAAAWHLRQAGGTTWRITVLDAAPVIGGKLRVSEVAGQPVDEGADSVLARRPEAVALIRAVGLGDPLCHPRTNGAAVLSHAKLRPIPRGTFMGIPCDLHALARSRVLDPAELARVPLDHFVPRTPMDGDVPVGFLVAARVGRAVVDRLVEPLLGGVYAGHADALSLQATMPQLYERVVTERSLLHSVRALAASPGQPGPVFAGIAGGMGRLPDAIAAQASATVRTQAAVQQLRRTETGWRLTVGGARAPETLEADAVIIAVPPRPAGRLLATDAPSAATDLAGIESASLAIVTLAYPRSVRLPAVSGFLVPPVEDRLVKAATFSTSKWPWYSDSDVVIVRLSIGRYAEERDLQRDDHELAALAARDLADITGIAESPIDARVTRWGGALPQYSVGHVERVARIRAAVAQLPGLAVCGAAYDGVGIAACIAAARAAADRISSGLAARQNCRHD